MSNIRRVWITGARGFIGRHVASMSSSLGFDSFGLGHGAWPESEVEFSGLHRWINGEVSFANLDALAASCGLPSTVVHLAGGSSVGASIALPGEDFKRSVVAAGELAEWIRLRAPGSQVVIASSAAVYGSSHPGAISEDSTCVPYSPYGYHKRMAEMIFESYAKSFGLSVAIVRLFSVYGNGLRKQLLWDCCNKLLLNPDKLYLGGTGNELRDWLHVSDAAGLLLAAAQNANPNCPVINGGTGVGRAIRLVATDLCRSWGCPELEVNFSGTAREGDPRSLIAVPEKAFSFGWRPLVDWQDGLSEYVAWFRSFSLKS
jgi:UDP-glucose 4-epimerase